MREVVMVSVRYSIQLKREIVYRLTYSVSDGPRPETERWFLLRKEECQDIPVVLHQGAARA
jgi:hypothetical protein